MLIKTQSEIQSLRQSLDSSDNTVVAIDTETNYTDLFYERYCMGISVCVVRNGEYHTAYIPVRHSNWITEANNLIVPHDLFSGIQCPIIMHNAKFDLQVLKKIGVTMPTQQLYDTMLMHHYIDEYPPHDLDSLGKLYLGYHKEKDLQRAMKTSWDDMPAFAMAKYAEQDAKVTADLYLVLKPQFEQFEDIWNDVDKRFLLLLTEVEEKGIRINRALAQTMSDQCDRRMKEIAAEVGFDPAKPSQLHPRLFDSPPLGLGLKVASRTPTGKPKVDDEYLSSIGHPLTALVLEYRGLSKQKSTYFDAYLSLTTRDYPVIHPTFQMHGTVTGRLSSARPNLQQVPRDSKVKDVFIADEGKQLWEVDYRNLEMRLAAVYSQNETLLTTFRAEGDVHQQVADDLQIDRHKAKTVNFLIIYGGGKKVLAKQLGISESEAQKILTKYRQSYPEIFEKMDDASSTASNTGEVRYWTGRKRHFKWPSEAHKAFNSVVQGGGFEIVKRGMLKLQEAGFDIRNQVHDSAWLYVDSPADIKEAEDLMADWTEEIFGLRFTCDSKRLN